MNNFDKIATGILGGTSPSVQYANKPKKGFWYWLIIFPIKWTMILTIGLSVAMLAVGFMFIAFIPWVIVRLIQRKTLTPDFLTQRGKTETK